MKLRTRFTIIFFSIIFISLSFLGIILLKNSQRILMQNTLNNLDSQATLIHELIDNEYDRYLEQLHIASHRVPLYKALEDYIADKSSENKEKLKNILKVFEPVVMNMEDMYIFDTKGQLMAGTSPVWDRRDVSHQTFFKKGLRGDFFNFVKKNESDKYAGLLTMSTFIMLHNQIKAVILIVLKQDVFTEITRLGVEINKSEDILLAKRNAKGDAEFIAQFRFQDQENALSIVPKIRTDISITQALAGNENVFDNAVDYRGKLVLSATKYCELLGIGIVVKVDRDEYQRPVQELNRLMMIFVGIIMFFTLIITFIIARSISIPIEQLSRSSQDIFSGSLNAHFSQIENNEKDEIGILSNSLQEMSQKLIIANKNLESKVQMRTEELQKRLLELEQFNKVVVGRELQMIELKKKINQLSRQLNLKEPYDLIFLREKNKWE
jgi:HAMP domain-containing protein